MNTDMSEMMENLSKMMNNPDMTNNIKNILNNMNNNSNSSSDNKVTNDNISNSNSHTTNSNNTTSNPFENIDMNTIFKVQQIMNSVNDKQNDYRTNLLLSLKPYLKESRKSKVDQYIQLMKIGKVFEVMNPLGGDNKHA